MTAQTTGATPREIRASIGTIIEVVAKLYKTTPAALVSRSRRTQVMIPRQVAMYLCRRYTDQPVSKIARAFRRSHPSVHNALCAVERMRIGSALFRSKVETLSALLDERCGPAASRARLPRICGDG